MNGSALGVDLSSQMLALAATDRRRRRPRQRRVPTRRRADHPVRERRVRRRDLAHGFDVLRRSRSRRSPTSIARCAPTVDSHSSPGRASPTTSGSPSSARPWPSAATSRHHRPTPPAPSRSPTPIACEPSSSAAGFADISFESLHEPMSFGPDPDDAFDFVSELTGWMRNGLDQAGRDAALAGPPHHDRRTHRRPRRHLPIRDLDQARIATDACGGVRGRSGRYG